MPLLFDSVSHRFGRQKALDGVCMTIEDGDCYGFLGHNGAGKTTAMRIALGLMRPDSGRVFVDGFDARRHPREARARMGGLIEVPGFHQGWNGSRNLAVLARLQGMGPGAARREARRMLEVVGLRNVGKKPVRAYSQGMRQRLGIAQTLLGTPRYVLLDEPTNCLDPEGIVEIRNLLRRLGEEEKVTVLISSHQLAELSDLTNRVGVIRQGRLIVEGRVSELLHGNRREYRLRAQHAGAAAAVLSELGLAHQRQEDDLITVDLDSMEPDPVLQRLVAGRAAVTAFAPKQPTLEEFYLRYTRGEAAAAAPAAVVAGPARARPPAERLAPRFPLLRILRYDTARWATQVSTWLLLLSPAVLGVLSVWRRKLELSNLLAEVEAGTLATTSQVTAFEGVGIAISAGFPLLAFLALGLASQSVASERGQGTLRNLLLRPLRRWELGVGKGLSVLLAVLASYIFLLVGAIAASSVAFKFEGLTDLLPNGELYVFPDFTADKLWGYLRGFVAIPLLPLAALAGLGFLAGSVVRRGTAGLALALIMGAFMDILEKVLEPLRIESWLPSAYVPVLLPDNTTCVQYYIDIVRGAGNAVFRYQETTVSHPALLALGAFALGTLVLIRRPVP